ncbi:MAG: hypothetical protein AAF841_05830 [Pseudomonadota bacterium]
MPEQTSIEFTTMPALEARVDAYFIEMGMGLNSYTIRRERKDILCWLNAKSDGELMLMGLSRKDLPEFVFGDLFSPG